jgi:hypothetical protein
MAQTEHRSTLNMQALSFDAIDCSGFRRASSARTFCAHSPFSVASAQRRERLGGSVAAALRDRAEAQLVRVKAPEMADEAQLLLEGELALTMAPLREVDRHLARILEGPPHEDL